MIEKAKDAARLVRALVPFLYIMLLGYGMAFTFGQGFWSPFGIFIIAACLSAPTLFSWFKGLP